MSGVSRVGRTAEDKREDGQEERKNKRMKERKKKKGSKGKEKKENSGLTKRDLKTGVQKYLVGRRVLGAIDLVCFHKDLGVETSPFTRTLLQRRGRARVRRSEKQRRDPECI